MAAGTGEIPFFVKALYANEFRIRLESANPRFELTVRTSPEARQNEERFHKD